MNFSGIRVLVVGDVMLDRYVACRVSRISPEAPVPVAGVEKRWSAPGGAANVARNLLRLGAAAFLVGLVGQDEAGHDLRHELVAEGIADGLVDTPSRATTRKTRIIAQGQQLLRLDEEHSGPLDESEIAALRQKALAFLPDCDALLLSDYGKGVLLEGPAGGLCAPLIAEANRKGIPVLVDPKGSDWQRYAGADCVTPNSAEFAAACGLAGDELARAEREALARDVRESNGIQRLLLTRGARGMALFENDAAPVYIRAAVREVADVSGAGDTVIAVLAACAALGLSWEASARAANAAAGVAVSKMGTAPVSAAELCLALHENVENPKLYAVPALREKVEEWRRRNESIVFTNGCFDLLHPGHISLVRQCAALGDRLVVGINSDASVRRLKGPSRPVQDEQSRALLLSALQGVDAVIIFDQATPLELICALRPDVLVKGGDYTLETVVGAAEVQSWGGSVHLVRLIDGCSTTELVRRMGDSHA